MPKKAQIPFRILYKLDGRFWSKVDKEGPTQPHMETPCWEWTAATGPGGYGCIRVSTSIGHRVIVAHRVSYASHNGDIPDGLLVCHHCDFRRCVRPDHLFLGTNHSNATDASLKGRMHQRLTTEEIRQIRALWPGHGLTQQEIATRFKTTQPHISNIIAGRRRFNVS